MRRFISDLVSDTSTIKLPLWLKNGSLIQFRKVTRRCRSSSDRRSKSPSGKREGATAAGDRAVCKALYRRPQSGHSVTHRSYQDQRRQRLVLGLRYLLLEIPEPLPLRVMRSAR